VSTTHLIAGVASIVAGAAGFIALILRERLLKELRRVQPIHTGEFPIHIPLLLERAHKTRFPASKLRTEFRYAYTTAVTAVMISATAYILIDFGL
jgi:hypothetical protein